MAISLVDRLHRASQEFKASSATLLLVFSTAMIFSTFSAFVFTVLVQAASGATIPASSATSATTAAASSATSNATYTYKGIPHYPPSLVSSNDLTQVFNASAGTNGGFYNSSSVSDELYGSYNYCNMPHVRSKEYPDPRAEGYNLQYVELIHRHHKRTPYASNTYEKEDHAWYCDNAPLYAYASPLGAGTDPSADIRWNVYSENASMNPFMSGPNGTCQFPQITLGGLNDSKTHGSDIFGVYGTLLGFLPRDFDAQLMRYRVTNNVITSQVASALIVGMYPNYSGNDFSVAIQPDAYDTLEPAYSCSGMGTMRTAYQSTDAWYKHLNDSRTQDLFAKLDSVSKVDSDDSGWHSWFDHYFDSFSSRLCHGAPLPCEVGNSTNCVTEAEAEQVFRLADYEYNYIFREALNSTAYSTARYGLFLNELVTHLEAKSAGGDSVIYRHNIAHDGSISPLLGALQIPALRWPGMGSEVSFELWTKTGESGYFLRVLYGGQVLTSNALGELNMIKLETFTDYIKILVGDNLENVIEICEGE